MALFSSIIKQARSGSNASLYQSIRCMSSKLYIGGLSYNTNEQGLAQAFTPYGEVTEAKVITDRTTGSSRGFGFVSFDSDEAANNALAMDGQDLDGRRLSVKHAIEKPRGGGGNYGGYGGGGGNYGGYGGGGNYNNGGGNYNNGGGNYNDGGNYNGGGGYGETNKNYYNGGGGDSGAPPTNNDGFADSTG